MAEGFDRLFGQHQIMIVLRGLSVDETVAAAHRAWDCGVELVEVPIGSPDQVPALAAAVSAGAGRGKHVGAGTVITDEQVIAAKMAGARYTVAPGFDASILNASLEAGLPHLPGVATPSEVQHAFKRGCTWLKFFPAGIIGGAAWVRAVREPFPELRFVATGRVATSDVGEMLAAGAHVVAFGAHMAQPSGLFELRELVIQHRS